MASRENQISLLTLVTVAIMLAVFAGLVWFVVEQRRAIPTFDDTRVAERLQRLAELNTDNQKILTTYRWVDKAKGVVGIPISRAMDLVVKDLSNNHPHPAGPISLPVTQPSAAPAPTPISNNAPAPTPVSSPVPSPAANPSPVNRTTPVTAAAPSPESVSSPVTTVNPAETPAANPSPAATPETTPAAISATGAVTPGAGIIPSSAPAGEPGSTPSPQP